VSVRQEQFSARLQEKIDRAPERQQECSRQIAVCTHIVRCIVGIDRVNQDVEERLQRLEALQKAHAELEALDTRQVPQLRDGISSLDDELVSLQTEMAESAESVAQLRTNLAQLQPLAEPLLKAEQLHAEVRNAGEELMTRISRQADRLSVASKPWMISSAASACLVR
jgi:DNA repair exonuclease SbcCD ATPase subunit